MSYKDSKPPIAHHSKKMRDRKKIALVAHDHRKADLIDWCEFNSGSLKKHDLFGTGTTASLISEKWGLTFMPLKADRWAGTCKSDRLSPKKILI